MPIWPFSDRHGFLVMSLSQITIWPTLGQEHLSPQCQWSNFTPPLLSLTLSLPAPFEAGPFNAARESGECCELPQWGPGWSPGWKCILEHFGSYIIYFGSYSIYYIRVLCGIWWHQILCRCRRLNTDHRIITRPGSDFGWPIWPHLTPKQLEVDELEPRRRSGLAKMQPDFDLEVDISLIPRRMK